MWFLFNFEVGESRTEELEQFASVDDALAFAQAELDAYGAADQSGCVRIGLVEGEAVRWISRAPALMLH